MRESHCRVIKAWIDKKRLTSGHSYTDGEYIYYFDNAVCRRNINGTFSIKTCGYAQHKSIREFINTILYHMYGTGAPRLYTENYVVYIRFIEETTTWDDNNNWFEFTDKENFIDQL